MAYLGVARYYLCSHILLNIERFEIALVIELKNKALKRDDVCLDNFFWFICCIHINVKKYELAKNLI